jgi:hypothetical protein
MAMPRKGSRLIAVDGTTYRWAVGNQIEATASSD